MKQVGFFNIRHNRLLPTSVHSMARVKFKFRSINEAEAKAINKDKDFFSKRSGFLFIAKFSF